MFQKIQNIITLAIATIAMTNASGLVGEASMGKLARRRQLLSDNCFNKMRDLKVTALECTFDKQTGVVSMEATFNALVVNSTNPADTVCLADELEVRIQLTKGRDDVSPTVSQIERREWTTNVGDKTECGPNPFNSQGMKCTYALSAQSRDELVVAGYAVPTVSGCNSCEGRYEEAEWYFEHTFWTILTTVGGQVSYTNTRYVKYMFQIQTYLEIGFNETNCKDLTKGTAPFWEDCIPPNITAIELIPDCGDCIISERKSAYHYYANSSWVARSARDFSSLNETIYLVYKINGTSTRKLKLQVLHFSYDFKHQSDPVGGWVLAFDDLQNIDNMGVSSVWDDATSELRVTIAKFSLGEANFLIWKGTLMLTTATGEFVDSCDATPEECTCFCDRRRILDSMGMGFTPRLLTDTPLKNKVAQQYLSEPIRFQQSTPTVPVDTNLTPDVEDGEETPKSNGGVIALVLLFVFLVIGIGGFVYWKYYHKAGEAGAGQKDGMQGMQQLPNNNMQGNQQ